MTSPFRFLQLPLLLSLFFSPQPLQAQVSESPIPEVLEDWVPWVLRDRPELGCPVLDGARVCAWPGRLALALQSDGGSFTLDVRVDRELDLPLPGGVDVWPNDIRVDGRSGLLRRSGTTPKVHLGVGTHRVTGRFSWTRLPGQMPLPASIALVDLSIGGKKVVQPTRESDGSLRLEGSGDSVDSGEGVDEDVLAFDVHRRVDDGVPVQLTTRLLLRVSGRAREVDLGSPLTEGFEPVELTSNLPSRLDDEGHLRVQLRPGTWKITLRSRSTGPVASIGVPQTSDPWPTEETWVFSAASAVRAVQVSGAPGVDPQRTSLGADWKGLPAYRVARGGSLKFDEIRRGEADPPPDSIQVRRELWLSEDRGGLIVRDSVTGQFHEGGRLHLLAPGELGHVKLGARERVINVMQGLGGAPTGTDGGDATGVEVRKAQVSMVAESSYPRATSLPAVGWDRDASSLSATLNLPPGWSLLAAVGVDTASSTWIERWSLLDLFFLLLITLALFKTMGWRWGLLSFLVLGVAWHEHGAPKMAWLLLVGLSALLHLQIKPWLHGLLSVGRTVVVGVLALQVVLFSWGQVRTGLFPQLDRGGWSPYDHPGSYQGGDGSFGGGLLLGEGAPAAEPMAEYDLEEGFAENIPQKAYKQAAPPPIQSFSRRKKMQINRASQVDPGDVVQTGPGVPRWSWSSYSLEWSGPVSSEHNIRLFLLPPWAEALLSLLRVLGFLALAIRLGDSRRGLPSLGSSSGASKAAPATGALLVLLGGAMATMLLAPSVAQAEAVPDSKTLEDLAKHLSKGPDCLSSGCVEVPQMTLRATQKEVRIEAEVHVLSASAWRIPGPSDSWMPTRVVVDGVEVRALRRGSDDFLALRLEAGRHSVVVTGPGRDEFSLQFPLVPRRLDWDGTDWSIDGYRPDAPPPRSVTLRRAEGLQLVETNEGRASPGGSAEMPAWLELRRELDVGMPWLVHNELRRLGPTRRVVHARIPLLNGESVTTPGIVVEEGKAGVTLEQGESIRRWDSTLEETETLVLTAPTDQPWMETWDLDCSPIWSCSADGLAPTRHMRDGNWNPGWQPWPGESVTFNFRKPLAVSGATTTVDQVALSLEPGRRVMASSLNFSVRSSQGGEQWIQIPEDATVQSFSIDGLDTPVEVRNGELVYSLQPGSHSVKLDWRQPHARGLVAKTPAVTLSSGSANVMVTMRLPDNKWLIWAGGPSWGAVVTLWQYVLVLLLAAWLLGRYAPTELKMRHWFILGLGMTQVPVAAPVVVVLWLALLGLRGRREDLSWWSHNLAQLGLVGLSLLALGMIYWAVHSGLLFQPDMQVAGAGSSGSVLNWFEHRTSGPLPTPWVLWLPLWVWRVGMLVWALWLATQLFRWALWGWKQMGVGGLWKMPPPKPAKETPQGRARPGQAAPADEVPEQG